MSKVEEKLFENRYRVDEGRPHIKIVDPAICLGQCSGKQCAMCCPAGCYAVEDGGHVVLTTDGCLECGTCRVVCDEHFNVDWAYPRGGFGILYKFG